MANATTPKRTRKGGYRGLQHRTIENITKMRATLKAEPGISLQATAATRRAIVRAAAEIGKAA